MDQGIITKESDLIIKLVGRKGVILYKATMPFQGMYDSRRLVSLLIIIELMPRTSQVWTTLGFLLEDKVSVTPA